MRLLLIFELLVANGSGVSLELALVVGGRPLGRKPLLLLLAGDLILGAFEVVDLLLLLSKFLLVLGLVGRELRVRLGIGHLVAGSGAVRGNCL